MENLANITLFILQGAVITLKIYFVTIIFSIPLGMLCAMGKLTKIPPLRWILGVYTWVFRGTPLLLQLLFVYFGLPYLGLELSREMAAYVTFVINYAAYFTEIFRAGIQSIDRGQYEAAKALGFLVVIEIDRSISIFCSNLLQIVPFPAPDGPETTNKRPLGIFFPFINFYRVIIYHIT